MANYKSKKGIVTRKDYIVTNMRTAVGRNYAVVYRPSVNDFVVANGYNVNDGTWASGIYGFSTRKKAINYAQRQADKYKGYFRKRYPLKKPSWRKK